MTQLQGITRSVLDLVHLYKGCGQHCALVIDSMRAQDALDAVLDMRECDVPYHMRFQIDTGVRCGHWHTVRASHGHVSLAHRADLLQRGEPRICAFDIETTKLPLQFPNAEFDQARSLLHVLVPHELDVGCTKLACALVQRRNKYKQHCPAPFCQMS